MKNSKKYAKIIALAFVLVLIASVMISTFMVKAQEEQHGGQPGTGYEGPTTIPSGQTADFTIYPLAFLSVSSNPIGIGQQLLVNVWITFPSGEGKYMTGYVVTITKPDGVNVTVNLKSYVADGISWFSLLT
jgi:hypothetical protein